MISDALYSREITGNRGGPNPNLTKGRIKPLGLKDAEVDAIVAFLESLDGEGYQDTPPKTFPQ